MRRNKGTVAVKTAGRKSLTSLGNCFSQLLELMAVSTALPKANLKAVCIAENKTYWMAPSLADQSDAMPGFVWLQNFPLKFRLHA